MSVSKISGAKMDNNGRRIKRFNKRLEKEATYRKQIIETATDTIMPSGRTVTSFKKYIYVNKNENVIIPFRFYEAKNSNQPLLIFHGGAGTLGYDNFKTLFEFYNDANGKAVVKSGCNVLIPQQMHYRYDIDDNYMLGVLSENIAELVKTLISKYSIDETRIYVYGISYGAMCTWKSLFNNPDLYTAAVETMGLLFDYEKADFQTIANIPIWLAHSSDDKVVKIDSDDYCYQKLKEADADVKYTRWDKYGHRMMRRFLKQEPWLEWMLSKRIQPYSNSNIGETK